MLSTYVSWIYLNILCVQNVWQHESGLCTCFRDYLRAFPLHVSARNGAITSPTAYALILKTPKKAATLLAPGGNCGRKSRQMCPHSIEENPTNSWWFIYQTPITRTLMVVNTSERTYVSLYKPNYIKLICYSWISCRKNISSWSLCSIHPFNPIYIWQMISRSVTKSFARKKLHSIPPWWLKQAPSVHVGS